MADHPPLSAADAADMAHERRHKRPPPSAPRSPRRAIRPLLLLVALVNLAWSLYQLPVSRVVESRLCREHYAVHDPSALRPDGSVPEELCKGDEVQQRLGRIQGVMEATWVAGDFLMTIPLVSLADYYGHHYVLCLNLVPRVFLLVWTFAVGYFDQVLPVNAILAAPMFSFLGGDCVFNSIVYSLVSELTDDHVLRATFFGYVNAVSSIFSLQLGPALASATMSTLLWLPFWIGIAILVLAIPVISALPPPTATTTTSTTTSSPSSDEEEEEDNPLMGDSNSNGTTTPPKKTLQSTTRHHVRTLLALLKNPTRNFLLLLAVFFLASLASSDTKLLTLYISKRYGWKFASVGYLLSVKALFNFFLLWVVIPRFLRLRRRRCRRPALVGIGNDDDDGQQNVVHAWLCLVFSVLGALAIALAPTVWLLVPALLVYALGIALPMFTYSLLKAPGMGLLGGRGHGGGEGRPGTQLFSVVMLVRTVGTLVGAVVMPGLWVTGLGIGGWALGMPFGVSAVCYAVAGVVVRRIEV
ncbi:major facilitator superfamily domain-containing protein [Chaetomidium leptoderma]|uniref:Major facilitator superfamily domain-containing protein n=1 Tax=Chaetomidium leptoderma TaxID=669021 RepID=A0AAN6VIX8_9PEZI|nr:major facilitator superfamily domain-containing protein [Chaetomidium leptoderma]